MTEGLDRSPWKSPLPHQNGDQRQQGHPEGNVALGSASGFKDADFHKIPTKLPGWASTGDRRSSENDSGLSQLRQAGHADCSCSFRCAIVTGKMARP